MKNIFLIYAMLLFIITSVHLQQCYREKTKKFIVFQETDFAFQNSLLIDGVIEPAPKKENMLRL